jgi:hypothetical protein
VTLGAAFGLEERFALGGKNLKKVIRYWLFVIRLNRQPATGNRQLGTGNREQATL